MTDIQHITRIFAPISKGICSSFATYVYLCVRATGAGAGRDFPEYTGFVNR